MINETAFPQVVDAGSRFYRAPELATGNGDGRADVFALGTVIFEAATRIRPEPLRKFPGMPVALYALLETMLARRPDDRPTAEAVMHEAARLSELFSDADGAIEEVEVELIDISRCPMPIPNLGWIPAADRIAQLHERALGSVRRRREH